MKDYKISEVRVSYEGDYIHAVIDIGIKELEAFFRITDKQNGEDLTLVSIDYGMNYEVISKEWDNIENDFKAIAIKHMEDTYIKAYGKSYNDENRKQLPLPLIIAYKVALLKLDLDKNK